MRFFHRHFWFPIATHTGAFTLGGGAGTNVLDRCEECGDTRVRTLNGHWTLEQLRGEVT